MTKELPAREDLFICFGHKSYQMASKFRDRQLDIRHSQAWSPVELVAQIVPADVLVISSMWKDELLGMAPKLRFIQSIGAGYNQFPIKELQRRNIRLASASGVNKNAVSEHVFAHILAFTRQIHVARDNQKKHLWRGLISQPANREHELSGKTVVIVGLGTIGSRTAQLAKAFGMRVLATKRNTTKVQEQVDVLVTPDQLHTLLPQADFVVLTCPLTPETENLINRESLSLMKESAYLVNVARGRCVDESSLQEAIEQKAIAGAALDSFWDEPLPDSSPFWNLENVLITPHTAGETQKYEDNVIDILLENMDRLLRGEERLVNQVV